MGKFVNLRVGRWACLDDDWRVEKSHYDAWDDVRCEKHDREVALGEGPWKITHFHTFKLIQKPTFKVTMETFKK